MESQKRPIRSYSDMIARRKRQATMDTIFADSDPSTPNPTFREDVYAATLEFCGTTLFLLLAFGGAQSAASSAGSATEVLMYQSASFGLALLVTAWLFYRVTGGLFNPNVSLALLLVKAISPLRFLMYTVAQLVGAIVAAALIQALLPGPLLINTAPSVGTSKAQAVFIEMFTTAALCFAVLMLAAEKHRATAFAPIGIGLTLFSGELFGIQFTGGSMNTARSFGPAVVTQFETSHWVYWVGPYTGALLATAFYLGLKLLRYERLNPNQDVESQFTKNEPTTPAGPSPFIPQATSSNGINALRVNAQMADVNGTQMMVATIPFMAIPSSNERRVEPTPLTFVFDQSAAPPSPVAINSMTKKGDSDHSGSIVESH